MKKKISINSTDKSKVIVVNILFATTITIIFLGIFFSIFSFVNHISFKILNSSIPGVLLGFLVFYLGIRYYLSVSKFKEELFKASSKFSWSNFRAKPQKNLVKK